ncbi:MAG: hypothetical protein DID92_2727745163 [Candidatus Nitrotoga sp. SPKER]|nr:MAG: hypothetical protein DID92_2727745163 [Candidatus Nitrotoga sp. SPKER]
MLNLILQSKQPYQMHALSLAILNAEVRESHRMRYHIVASKMSLYLSNANDEIERQMFNHFCEHVLPLTFRDWMKKD